MRVATLTAPEVVEMNRMVCLDGGNKHLIYDIGKVESALHSTFYPGGYPFQHGGIARMAGAMAYYLANAHEFYDGNKRTALIASLVFMEANGWELLYPMTEDGKTSLATTINASVNAGALSKEQVMDFYDRHKVVAS